MVASDRYVYQFQVKPEKVTCGNCTCDIQSTVENALNGSDFPPDAACVCSVDYSIICVSASSPLTEEQRRKVRVAITKAKTAQLLSLEEVQEVAANKAASSASASNDIYRDLAYAALGCLAGAASLYLSMCGMGVPWWVLLLNDLFGITLTGYLGWDTFKQAYHALFNQKKLNMHVLFSLNAIVVLMVSMVAWFVPSFPRLIYTALLLFGFKYVGDLIKKQFQLMVADKTSFQVLAPSKVWLEESENVWKYVHISSLQKNNIIHLKKNDIIPVDCVAIEDGEVFEEILNGDSEKLIPKKVGETLLAGVRASREMSVKVLRIQPASYLARLDNDLLVARLIRPKMEDNLEKIMRYFIPVVLGIALLAGVIFDWMSALSILVGVCPCAVYTIIPSAFSACLSKAVKLGVLFTEADVISRVTEMTTLFIDRTGTLTKGKVEVHRHKKLDRALPKDEFYNIAHALEKAATHPIAKAILNYIADKKSADYEVSKLDASHHAGIEGVVNKKKYYIGDINYMQDKKISLSPNLVIKIKKWSEQGNQITLLADANKVIGYFVSIDPIKEGAVELIAELNRRKIKINLLTGSDEFAARATAKAVGIPEDNIIAKCKDANAKLKKVTEVQAAGEICGMIGDGVNDLLALKQSDVGVLIEPSGQRSLPQERAVSIIIKDDTLYPVLNAFKLADQTKQNIREGFAITGVYNAVAMLLACGIWKPMGCLMPPWVCMGMMFAQSICVMLNAEWLKYQSVPNIRKKETESTGSTWGRLAQSVGLSRSVTVMPSVNQNSRVQLGGRLSLAPIRPVNHHPVSHTTNRRSVSRFAI